MAGDNNFGDKFGKIKSADCCLFWFEGTVYTQTPEPYILGELRDNKASFG